MEYVYCVYDRASQTYVEPIVVFPTDEVAVRSFMQSVKPGSIMYQYPEDYCLRKIGAWMNESQLVGHKPEQLGNSPILSESDLVEFESEDFPFIVCEAVEAIEENNKKFPPNLMADLENAKGVLENED